MIKMVVE